LVNVAASIGVLMLLVDRKGIWRVKSTAKKFTFGDRPNLGQINSNRVYMELVKQLLISDAICSYLFNGKFLNDRSAVKQNTH